jgi:hypothetical protein
MSKEEKKLTDQVSGVVSDELDDSDLENATGGAMHHAMHAMHAMSDIGGAILNDLGLDNLLNDKR